MMTNAHVFQGFYAPGPVSSPETLPFWHAAAQRQLDIQFCTNCETWVFYPRHICPHCWSKKLEWRTASGRAKLKTWSEQHRPGHPAWTAIAPYTVGIVVLQEGPSMLTTILGDPNKFRAGLPLIVRFVTIGATTLPMFESAG